MARIRRVEAALGDGVKRATPGELANAQVVRANDRMVGSLLDLFA